MHVAVMEARTPLGYTYMKHYLLAVQRKQAELTTDFTFCQISTTVQHLHRVLQAKNDMMLLDADSDDDDDEKFSTGSPVSHGSIAKLDDSAHRPADNICLFINLLTLITVVFTES